VGVNGLVRVLALLAASENMPGLDRLSGQQTAAASTGQALSFPVDEKPDSSRLLKHRGSPQQARPAGTQPLLQATTMDRWGRPL
tara:strand:- start:6243 stop:6494 length:252 start_codon:yes stop_codon:yes gene_type:complete